VLNEVTTHSSYSPAPGEGDFGGTTPWPASTERQTFIPSVQTALNPLASLGDPSLFWSVISVGATDALWLVWRDATAADIRSSVQRIPLARSLAV